MKSAQDILIPEQMEPAQNPQYQNPTPKRKTPDKYINIINLENNTRADTDLTKREQNRGTVYIEEEHTLCHQA